MTSRDDDESQNWEPFSRESSTRRHDEEDALVDAFYEAEHGSRRATLTIVARTPIVSAVVR
jgi:hypothetical protein